jgi:hypothetical protein
MFPDKFPQSRYHIQIFPCFSGSPLGTFTRVALSSKVQLNFVGCPPDFILKFGACTQVRGTAHELRPSPSFLIQPFSMVSNSDLQYKWPKDLWYIIYFNLPCNLYILSLYLHLKKLMAIYLVIFIIKHTVQAGTRMPFIAFIVLIACDSGYIFSRV